MANPPPPFQPHSLHCGPQEAVAEVQVEEPEGWDSGYQEIEASTCQGPTKPKWFMKISQASGMFLIIFPVSARPLAYCATAISKQQVLQEAVEIAGRAQIPTAMMIALGVRSGP